ncbi:hypothetical protein BDV30DRAFT_169382 [Aspergillus minisclerotigenes]|uniref:Uncharacterized protein n=1 Tax=Aspergillus minisclerotigenes TaxID=656917 RepID=A0A5N6JJE1_9EURO|nr:hypothetical protein BDV30DRAFT_169382 [Aspergillus minisclerotigenes]
MGTICMVCLRIWSRVIKRTASGRPHVTGRLPLSLCGQPSLLLISSEFLVLRLFSCSSFL